MGNGIFRAFLKKLLAGYGLNEFFLSLYTAFILSSVYLAQLGPRLGKGLALPGWVLMFVGLFILCSLLAGPFLRRLGALRGRRPSCTFSVGNRFRCFLVFFLAAFFSMAVWYAAYYPGWFTGDSEWQLSQAVSGEYNDWHPALQTFLTFTVPLTLTGDWKGSVILFQIIEYSLAVSFLCMTFLRCGDRRYAVVSLLLIVLNPLTGAIVKQPWKDVTFTIFCVLLAGMALRVYYHPAWLRKPLHVLFLSLVFGAATLVRHNGVLFTVPMLAAVLLLAGRRKTRVLLVTLSLAALVLIRGPFYGILGVTDPGRRSVETLGLPMTVIGNVVKYDPEALDGETLAFVWSVAAPEVWDEYYHTGDFNSVKFTEFCSTQAVNDAGPVRVLQYMFRCFRASPAYALEGLLSLTNMVYAVSGPVTWTPEFFPPLLYSLLSNSFLRYLSLYIGIPTFLCIAISLGCCRLTDRKAWQKLPFLLALLIHNWGTMLLLTGPDFRFFYLTFPVSAAVVFLMQNDASERTCPSSD